MGQNGAPAIARWTSIDPITHHSNSTYNAFDNNPIFWADLSGANSWSFIGGSYLNNVTGETTNDWKKAVNETVSGSGDSSGEGSPPDDYVFDENGNYARTDITGKPDRLVVEDSNSGIKQHFNFGDPINDVKDIKFGDIKKLVFVSNADIRSILTASGAFDLKNKNSWSFLYKESKGGGDLDFSYGGIPDFFSNIPEVSNQPQYIDSGVLFLPEGDKTVLNHMNFGNYLWGAAGTALGFSPTTLQAGAHANSLLNSKGNGYDSQWDSKDDQWSIFLGTFHANKYKFGN